MLVSQLLLLQLSDGHARPHLAVRREVGLVGCLSHCIASAAPIALGSKHLLLAALSGAVQLSFL